MAVYYKFKSARDYDLIPMDGPFISVGTLKEKIFESKHLGRGTDFDLVVTNAQTNEEYLDEAMLIPKNTSVLIRRVPGQRRMPIVTEQEPKAERKMEEALGEKSSFMAADSSTVKYTEDPEWDEFGNDLYAIPEARPVQPTIPDVAPTNNADEESKIKALIETPALDWQRQGADGFGPGRGFGRGMGGRMGGRGFGFERKTPPQGYVCHRCKIPGHFIQHCPTNGDPNYDIKRVKPPTGIPKSMLQATPDGSYVLPSGAVAVLKPNEAAFEKEIEGLPSTRSVGELPPELHCPLCKEVMKDAVLTSKCCFNSFCDKCIRDHIISKAQCVCGATDILADDLLPNKTLRDTINRILESGNSSADNTGSTYQVQDMESARGPQPRIPSPTMSAASKEQPKPQPANEDAPNPNTLNKVVEKKPAVSEQAVVSPQLPVARQTPVAPQEVPEKVRTAKLTDASEATAQGGAFQAEEEVQQKLPLGVGEAAKKKKKKKICVPQNDMWKGAQDFAAENYMMPMGPSSYNPYWSGMQPGMDGYMAPYAPGPMPFMGYGLGPMDMPFPGMMPPDPYLAQGFMMPPVMPPHRDPAEMGMGMNVRPRELSRGEFEARKAELRQRRESERRPERELSRDRDFSREMSNGADVPSLKSKSIPQSSNGNPRAHHHHRSERMSPDRPPRDTEPPPRCSKRKAERLSHDHEWDDRDRDYGRDNGDRDRHRHHEHRHHPESSTRPPSESKPTSTAFEKHKASVFSRISYPEGESTSKKRKISTSVEAATGPHLSSSSHHKLSSSANGYYEDRKASSVKAVASGAAAGRKSSSSHIDYESSDDDKHFKRKPSRYEPSPPPSMELEEMKHQTRGGSRDRDRDRDHSRHNRHR